MKVTPYPTFGGNCSQAIALYEKAFNVKAQIMRYKDAPPDSEYQFSEGTDDYVMHAQLQLGNDVIMFCDQPPEQPIITGTNMAISVAFDDVAAANAAFDVLKEGGTVDMELQETFWSKYFGTLVDKFGICWQITLDEKE